MNRAVRLASGSIVAIIGAAILAPGSAAQADATARDLARELCKTVAPGGATIQIVGPRVRWSAPVPSIDTKQEMQSLIGRAAAARGFLIDANGGWVTVHHIDTRTTVLMSCAGGEPFTAAHDFRPTAIAVSQSGDLALRTEVGDVVLALTPDAPRTPRMWSAPVNRARGPGHLLWLERRLVVIDRDRTYGIDLVGRGFRTIELPVSGLPDTVLALWAYRGLTFVLGADGCIDLLVDATLTPHLRRAACIAAAPPGDAYIGFDLDNTRVFTPAGELSWEGSRLLALSATLSGTVREITANLQKIAAAPWTPAVPVMLGSPTNRAVPPSTADLDWSAIVDADLWASPRDFKSGLAAFDAKGWSALRKDGTWTTGTGIGLRWQSGPEFVAPDRRSLSALGRELYYEKVYRDEHIDNILTANAPLGRSLEGRLFSLGWIPIGAAFGSADRTPLAMTGVPSIGNLLTQPKHNLQADALKAIEPFKSLKSVESCRFAEATPEESIARVVADGVGMLGRSGVSSQISRSTNPQLKAGAAVVVRCTNARGVPLRLLVLRTAMLDSDEGRARARAGEKIDASANALVFVPTTDASWPVGIQSDIIVAVGLDQPIAASVRTAFLRSWLDDVFRFGRVDRVLIRVSFLEMVVAATASWQPRAESFAKVRVVPAERVSGEARSTAADPACTTEEALLDQQKLFHALLKLNGIPPANLAVDVPIIGIVESSVMRSIPIFKRADGRSVWVFLNEGRFVIFEDDDPVPIDARSLHGTRVAGLVFSASPPTGVLSDARLTWVDESQPSATVLSKLAGNNDIVNFSRSLHGGWSNLLQTAARFWTPALFVAAAHNKNEGATLTPEQDQQENDDGMPISWHLPNIVGVGVADAEGKTSEKVLTSYLREQVDLLAPGYMVPAVGPVPEKPTCLDGTSYAAAYVSAVAALVQQRGHGMLTASQLRARLLATASWKPEYWDHVKGGLVDAGLALDGLFENVLTFPSAEDATKPGLRVTVKLDERSFEATGEEFGVATLQVRQVFWSDVLRLRKTGTVVDAAGRTQSQFYMAFVDGGRYRVWRNATISTTTSAMPVTACTRRDGVAVTCTATDVNGIFDYVGERYRQPSGITAF